MANTDNPPEEGEETKEVVYPFDETLINRLEAIRRTPEYIQDYTRWQDLCVRTSQGGKRKTLQHALHSHVASMQSRWDLCPPFPPLADTPLHQWDRFFAVPPFTTLEAVTTLNPYDHSSQAVLSKIVEGYSPLRLKSRLGPQNRGAKIAHQGGRHICVILDVTKTKQEVLERVESQLNYFQGKLVLSKKRNKPMKEDIWAINDRCARGESLGEITRDLLYKNKPGNEVSNKYEAKYNAVERALKKALELIAAASRRAAIL
jgi:hypothetical protein